MTHGPEEKYIPRHCSATNRIIGANDNTSVQVNFAELDENGVYTGQYRTYAMSGDVRRMGASDDQFNRLSQADGLLKNVWSPRENPIY